MKTFFKKNLYELILLLVFILELITHFLLKTSLTNYDFAKQYINDIINKFNNAFIYMNILAIISVILIILTTKLKKTIILKILFMLLAIMIFVMNAIIFTNTLVKVKCDIAGNSMYPTIKDGSKVMLNYTKDIQRFDVIIFKVDSDSFDIKTYGPSYYIKRVIGMPGDKVVWKNKELYINDTKIDETYLDKEFLDSISSNDFLGEFKYKQDLEVYKTFIIPNNYYFVLGDNRAINSYNKNESYDSREIGLVPKNNIVGKISQK